MPVLATLYVYLRERARFLQTPRDYLIGQFSFLLTDIYWANSGLFQHTLWFVQLAVQCLCHEQNVLESIFMPHFYVRQLC